MERSVRVGDLALIDQAEGVRSRLSAHARERVALTAIDASSSADLRAFPAAWVCTSGVAAALLERLDDHEMSQWMARQALTEQPEIARRIAASGVDAWRHGLVAVSADRLGRTVVLESLNARASGHADDRSLTAARSLGDAGRVRDLVGGVLGGIGKGLTADEAVSILWREDDVEPSRPVLRGEEDEWPSPAHRHGHRYKRSLPRRAGACVAGRPAVGRPGDRTAGQRHAVPAHRDGVDRGHRPLVRCDLQAVARRADQRRTGPVLDARSRSPRILRVACGAAASRGHIECLHRPVPGAGLGQGHPCGPAAVRGAARRAALASARRGTKRTRPRIGRSPFPLPLRRVQGTGSASTPRRSCRKPTCA